MTRSVVRRALVPFLLAMPFVADGIAETAVSLALVIDRSGSLSANDLALTRQLARSVFESLPAGSEAAVFVFDDQSRLVRPLTPNADEVLLALEEVRTSGKFTALHDALYDASRYLRDSGRGRRAILLVLLAAVAVVAALVLRRRSRARCPRCGGDLPSALSPCPSCMDWPARLGSEAATGSVSPTVVARMNITEEYLEKTVTLRERPVLVVTHGAATGHAVLLSPEVTTSIGRAKANDIVLDDVSVSSEHCRVRPEEGRFVLHDLKSTNGTFVNERRVTRHPLAEGDVIKVGETAMQFRMERSSS